MEDEVKITIPNGYMIFRLKAFLLDGRRGNIRKMFRMIQNDRRLENTKKAIPEWLRGQLQEAKALQKETENQYMVEKEKLAEAEETYKRMQNPCYAVFTRDKEKLITMRKTVRGYKKHCRDCMSSLKGIQKRIKRLREILKDAETFLKVRQEVSHEG